MEMRSHVRNMSMGPGEELPSIKISSFLLWIPRRNMVNLVVNRAGIHNHSLAAIANRGLSCTLHVREKPQMELPAS